MPGDEALRESNGEGNRTSVIYESGRAYTGVGRVIGGEGGAGRLGRKRRDRYEIPLKEISMKMS